MMTDPRSGPPAPAPTLMPGAGVPLAVSTRGDVVENVFHGSAVVCGPSGDVLRAWGAWDRTVLPRSSCKILQALPMVESGAAAAMKLTPAWRRPI